MPAEGKTIRLEIDGFGVEVSAPDDAALTWLREFMAPSFRSGPPGADPPIARVSLEPGSTRYADRSRARTSARLRTLDGFTLDGSFSRHEAWCEADGVLWAHDARGGVFYGVSDAGRSVRLVAERMGDRQRLSLMRAVRELVTVALLRADRLPLHASAFALDGEAVLACGPKRSGKTSLLVHALECRAEFLSNDRVFVDAGPVPVARGMPTIVTLRNGTLRHFARLSHAYPAARFDRGRTLAECAPGVARPEPRARPGADRPGISPAQLCQLLQAPMRDSAPVRSILLPQVDSSARGLRIEPLGPEQALDALERGLLQPSTPLRHSELFAPAFRGETIAAEDLAARCRGLLARAPAYACRLGPDAFATDLVAELRRAGVLSPAAPAAPAPAGSPGSRPGPRAP